MLGEICKEVRKEHQLIILCSKGYLDNDDETYIKNLLNDRLEWSEILFQAVNHRIVTIMYYHLKNLGLLDKVDDEIEKVLRNQSEVARLRNTYYFNELGQIYTVIKPMGIKAALLKGNYLAAEVYPSIETRTFNDIDLLVNQKDGSTIVSKLEELGYIQGDYDKSTESIIPASRKQIILHQMTTHEFQVCLKKSDLPFANYFEVDLNHDILWRGNCPYKVPTDVLLERTKEVRIFGFEADVLCHEDFLFQLMCHLYKEATVLNWISDLRDLRLYKFADIITYISKFKSEIKWDEFYQIVEKNQCQKIAYFVGYYVNFIYGDVIPKEILNKFQTEDLSYLNEYGIENEKPSIWKCKFSERLFNPDRVLEITEESLQKKNNFWESRS